MLQIMWDNFGNFLTPPLPPLSVFSTYIFNKWRYQKNRLYPALVCIYKPENTLVHSSWKYLRSISRSI